MRKDFKKEAPCLLSLEEWIEFEHMDIGYVCVCLGGSCEKWQEGERSRVSQKTGRGEKAQCG